MEYDLEYRRALYARGDYRSDRAMNHDFRNMWEDFERQKEREKKKEWLECNSSSNPHYLLHLPGQTCEIDIRGERSPVYRKPTHDEAYRFPRNIEETNTETSTEGSVNTMKEPLDHSTSYSQQTQQQQESSPHIQPQPIPQSQDPLTLTSVSILKKSPEPLDVYHLLQKKSADWNMFRRELELDVNCRNILARDSSLTDDDRLENVLTKWIEAKQSPVTWAKILEILQSLDLLSIAKKVNDYLQRPDVIMKYIKKEDYSEQQIF